MTIDSAHPSGISEIANESIHRFLDSIEPYGGAFNAGRLGRRGLAVTVSIDAIELEDSTFRSAAAQGEAIVREHLPVLGLGEGWVVESIEVSASDEYHLLHPLPMTATE